MEPPLSALPSCIICHQPLQPTFYFCPNCGTQVKQPPLSTTFSTALWMYTLSIILPSFCYIFIGKWKGLQYLKSEDGKAKTIGIIATLILIISTVVTFWYAYTYTSKIINESLKNITTDVGGE